MVLRTLRLYPRINDMQLGYIGSRSCSESIKMQAHKYSGLPDLLLDSLSLGLAIG